MLTRFYNAKILRDHKILLEDLWVKDGKIVQPGLKADSEVNVKGLLIAPGYIDLENNGCFGFDFSADLDCVDNVSSYLPKYGITSFLPTIVSSNPYTYKRILPTIQPRKGNNGQAEILGIHLDGPFLNPKQAGAHSLNFIKPSFEEVSSLQDFYGSLEGVKMITLAPELPGALNAIYELNEKGIIVAVGHSLASYAEMQASVKAGVKVVSHLYNAMTHFHHRAPGIIGEVLSNTSLFYSIIADSAHVHPAAIYIAWKANPNGLFLVSNAIAALGLPEGIYHLGTLKVQVDRGKAYIEGTKRLAGSMVMMDLAVRWLRFCTGCSAIEALEAASLKPAQILGIQNKKGTLNFGADADFIFLDDHLHVQATYIHGNLAWQLEETMFAME